jgi:uncharacterized protein YdeI (YjbR/CyaY-like superfamily)
MASAAPQSPTTFYAKDRKTWRKWLLQHHASKDSVWLIIYKKESGTPTVYYEEAVEEALCFGWIDSKPNKRDADSFLQFFARRKPRSNWSGLNKKRVARLFEEGLMMPAGIAAIEIAKQNGAWTALDKVDALEYPPELEKAFKANPVAKRNFEAFPPSTKRGILEWIGNAKRIETLQKRVDETVRLAAQNLRANQWKP